MVAKSKSEQEMVAQLVKYRLADDFESWSAYLHANCTTGIEVNKLGELVTIEIDKLENK